MSDKLLLGIDEAAQALSVSRRLVQSLIYAGKLPSVTVARRRLIAMADLVGYVDRLRQEATDGHQEIGLAPGPSSDSPRVAEVLLNVPRVAERLLAGAGRR